MNVLIDTGSSNLAVAAVAHPALDRYFNTSGLVLFCCCYARLHVPFTCPKKWIGSTGQGCTDQGCLAWLLWYVFVSHCQHAIGFAHSHVLLNYVIIMAVVNC